MLWTHGNEKLNEIAPYEIKEPTVWKFKSKVREVVTTILLLQCNLFEHPEESYRKVSKNENICLLNHAVVSLNDGLRRLDRKGTVV